MTVVHKIHVGLWKDRELPEQSHTAKTELITSKISDSINVRDPHNGQGRCALFFSGFVISSRLMIHTSKTEPIASLKNDSDLHKRQRRYVILSLGFVTPFRIVERQHGAPSTEPYCQNGLSACK